MTVKLMIAYMSMKMVDVIKLITKITLRTTTGLSIVFDKFSTFSMITYPSNVLVKHIDMRPQKRSKKPMPPVFLKVIECLRDKQQAVFADAQKDSPVKTTYVQAASSTILMYLFNRVLSSHPNILLIKKHGLITKEPSTIEPKLEKIAQRRASDKPKFPY